MYNTLFTVEIIKFAYKESYFGSDSKSFLYTSLSPALSGNTNGLIPSFDQVKTFD